MHNDIEINIGQVILSAMKKARYQQGHNYGFEGMLTRFLRRHRVDEVELDYKLDVFTRSIDI